MCSLAKEAVQLLASTEDMDSFEKNRDSPSCASTQNMKCSKTTKFCSSRLLGLQAALQRQNSDLNIHHPADYALWRGAGLLWSRTALVTGGGTGGERMGVCVWPGLEDSVRDWVGGGHAGSSRIMITRRQAFLPLTQLL